MYSVNATPTAAKVLAQVPGLRARVVEVLHGILATAEEIRRQGHRLDLRACVLSMNPARARSWRSI